MSKKEERLQKIADTLGKIDQKLDLTEKFADQVDKNPDDLPNIREITDDLKNV